jgi:hypothetical protein
MHITEIITPLTQSLYESIDAVNTTGYLTEDLVSIVHAHNADEWVTCTSASSLIESLNA